MPRMTTLSGAKRVFRVVLRNGYCPAHISLSAIRYRRIVGVNVALEGLREALRKKQATPAQIAKFASDARVWKTMEPYVSALTSDG